MRLLLIFLALIGFAVASPAYALDPGECGTPESMTTKLKAEGQRSAIMADQVMPGKKLQAIIFTTNHDGSVGYIMLSDKISDERASKFCVQERLTDLRWHDARKNEVPISSKTRGTDAEQCLVFLQKSEFSVDCHLLLNFPLARIQ